jgi:hypothetical protein
MLPAPPRPDDFYSESLSCDPVVHDGCDRPAGRVHGRHRAHAWADSLGSAQQSCWWSREWGEEAVDLSLPSVTTDARGGGTSFVLPLSLPSLSSDMLDDVDSNSTHLAATVEPAYGDRG